MIDDRSVQEAMGGEQRAVTPNRTAIWLFLGVIAAVFGSTTVAPRIHPLLLLGAVGALAVFFLTAKTIACKGYTVFWGYLTVLLFGYQFLGKGFGYVGVPPLYVGEIGLGLGLMTGVMLLLHNDFKVRSIFGRPAFLFLFAFMLWGALRTIPYVRVYGIVALRDAVLWGYAAFAILICLLIPRHAVDRFVAVYGRVLPYFMLWLPVAFVLSKFIHLSFRWPGSPVPLILLKSGNTGVHLAGVAAFVLLRLDQRVKPLSTAKLWLFWLLWGGAWVAYGASNRGGMLSALLGIMVVLFWQRKTRWDRPFILCLCVFGLLLLTNFRLNLLRSQELSLDQITDNFTSLVGQGEGQLEKTKQWRLNWWSTIIGYTINGEYFWTGKGYGINIGLDDGFASLHKDVLNRSPHNATFNILARSGVPGFVLWLLFLVSFGWIVLKGLVGSPPLGRQERKITIWLLAYWIAHLFNSSVTVFLEGPMGGIWFWALTGMILVYLWRPFASPLAQVEVSSPAQTQSAPTAA